MSRPDKQYEELYKWVEGHPTSRPKKNINRDFADAIPLVEILKVYYPKLVELHNYSPQNSHAQKLINWQTVNNKVLRKIKIHLCQKRIEQLAKAEPGVVENLLLEIKKKIDIKTGAGEASSLEATSANEEKEPPKPAITQEDLDNLQAEIDDRDETISMLESVIIQLEKKIEYLEDCIKTTEDDNKDLTAKIESLLNQAKPESMVSRFFAFFTSSSSSNSSKE